MDKKPNTEQKPTFRINHAKPRPVRPQANMPTTSILKSRKDKKIISENNNIKYDIKNNLPIPQDTKEEPKDSPQTENGDKNIQKITQKTTTGRTYKRFQTISEKKSHIFNSKQFNKICDKFSLDNINANQTERIEIINEQKKEKENGFDDKRSMTPKKKSKDVNIVSFDAIDKELRLEPKILESIEKQISFSDLEDFSSIYESFFIASIPKEEYSFAEDVSNSGIAYYFNNLGQCGHNCCLKLPSYKGGLIFQYPQKEKNEQNFQISELVISLCFPYGIKICFGKYDEEKPELMLPKKPSDFYFVTTNGYNERNFIYVYNFYLKMELEKFKSEYKCDPIKTYLNILIKNNDKNFQTCFEQCQNMINTSYVYIPHTACLVSKYPYFKEMQKCIYSIFKVGNSEKDLCKLLKNLIYEIPDINKYRTFDLQLNYFIPYSMYPIKLKSKYYNRGLKIDIKQLTILFEYFQIPLLLKIFKLMLASQKLLFVVKDSSEYQNLGIITLALLNLLYPFNWKYTYITLLSINMLKFLQSFLPFIMGIDSNMIEYAKQNYIEKQNNITIINLRKNRKSVIETENTDENADIEIPGELKEMLANDLQTIKKNYLAESNKEDKILLKLPKLGNSFPIINEDKTNENINNNDIKFGVKIREVFLKFFVEIFGDYQEYTSSIDETAYFNSESFLNNVPKEYHNFYLSIFNSEMFHDFLQRNVVVNSPLYKPDRYYNKYCIREKKGYNISKRNNSKKFGFKKKKTFLRDDFNLSNKQNSNRKLSPKNEVNRPMFKKGTVSQIAKSSKLVIQYNFNNALASVSNSLNINNKESSNNMESIKTELFKKSDNDSITSEEENDIDIDVEMESKSLDSSFNDDTLKNLVLNNVSNKYIIPPFFIKFEEIEKTNLTIKKIGRIIFDFYGQDNLIKRNEYDTNYIFDKLPIIQYENLSLAKKEDLDMIDRYVFPNYINNESSISLRHRSNTLVKSSTKDNKLEPKIMQLEDYMKEILSSSGKNAYTLLYPNGIKEANSNSINNGEEKEETKEEEKENGGSKDKSIGKINMGIGNKDLLSISDFQKKEIRRHFAFILFQKKDNAYQSNIISSDSFNILSKLIFNVFLYCGNKSIDDFQVCRALTKSLYLYYKKSSKGKKVYLYHFFNKAKPFDIWNDKAFWNYYFEREMENQKEKNDNNKFDVLIEISSLMNDLHFSANTQVDILIDSIAKKEIKDNELKDVLFKTIIKQFNNRMVVTASMDN